MKFIAIALLLATSVMALPAPAIEITDVGSVAEKRNDDGTFEGSVPMKARAIEEAEQLGIGMKTRAVEEAEKMFGMKARQFKA